VTLYPWEGISRAYILWSYLCCTAPAPLPQMAVVLRLGVFFVAVVAASGTCDRNSTACGNVFALAMSTDPDIDNTCSALDTYLKCTTTHLAGCNASTAGFSNAAQLIWTSLCDTGAAGVCKNHSVCTDRSSGGRTTGGITSDGSSSGGSTTGGITSGGSSSGGSTTGGTTSGAAPTTVSGGFSMTVNNAELFVNSAQAKLAVRTAVAKISGVNVNSIAATFSVVSRRLESASPQRLLQASGRVDVSYIITIPGGTSANDVKNKLAVVKPTALNAVVTGELAAAGASSFTTTVLNIRQPTITDSPSPDPTTSTRSEVSGSALGSVATQDLMHLVVTLIATLMF